MFKQLFAAAALAAVIASPAGAVTFESALTQGSTVVADYAGPRLISFDIDFGNLSAAEVEYRIDDGDIGAPIDFKAILRNFSGSGFTGFTITLSEGSFGTLGSVTRQFGGTAQTFGSGNTATIMFNTPEFLDVEFGNALGTTPNAANWTLLGLHAGDRITLTVTPVPEPGTYALMFGGLALLAGVARRRRQH
ncbi:MAG TPA: PEP-CTERM sorting domain-containing protein [Burkholderiaceae bacterium]